MSHLLKGDWIIVARKIGDTTSKGTIVARGYSEKFAKQRASVCNIQFKNRQYFAMHKESY